MPLKVVIAQAIQRMLSSSIDTDLILTTRVSELGEDIISKNYLEKHTLYNPITCQDINKDYFKNPKTIKYGDIDHSVYPISILKDGSEYDVSLKKPAIVDKIVPTIKVANKPYAIPFIVLIMKSSTCFFFVTLYSSFILINL